MISFACSRTTRDGYSAVKNYYIAKGKYNVWHTKAVDDFNRWKVAQKKTMTFNIVR